MNRYTNRLNLTGLLRMARLGLLEELLKSHAIWYCLSCGRCSNACPMNVKPSVLIAQLRQKAIERDIFPRRILTLLGELNRQFQRLRLWTVCACLNGRHPAVTQGDLDALVNNPVETDSPPPVMLSSFSDQSAFRKKAESYLGIPTGSKRCYTCSECRSACPICFERSVFDPLVLFRLTNLGLGQIALSSPSLWLCIQCGRCAEACPTGVKGHFVIHQLQSLAIQEGCAGRETLSEWHQSQKALYSWFLDRIDNLLMSVSMTGD